MNPDECIAAYEAGQTLWYHTLDFWVPCIVVTYAWDIRTIPMAMYRKNPTNTCVIFTLTIQRVDTEQCVELSITQHERLQQIHLPTFRIIC